MTDTTDTSTVSFEQSDLVRLWNDLQQLNRVLFDCKVNFEWLTLSNDLPITFLDADIIYGALPSLTMDSVVRENLPRGSDVFPFSVDSLPGPHAVQWLLKEIHRYCLPWGSMMEVASAHQQLSGAVSQGANIIQRCLDAIHAGQSFSSLRNLVPGKRLSEVFREHVLNVARGSDEIRMLDSLMDGAIDVGTLIGEGSDTKAEETFRVMLRQLSQERPGHRSQRVNFRDAMNAGIVVQVFNHTASTEAKHVLPVLISTTRPLLDNARILEDRLYVEPARLKRPRVVSGHLYLFLSHAILSHVGYHRFSVALNYTQRLEQDSQRLTVLCEQLLHDTRYSEAYAYNETSIEAHTAYHLNDLMERFRSEWNKFFLPYSRTRQFDRVAFVNSLLSKEIERDLDSERPEAVKRGARELIVRLRDSGSTQNVWHTIELYANNSNRASSIHARVPLFGCSRTEVSGTPLSDSQVGKRLDHDSDSLAKELSTPHRFRVLVHSQPAVGGAVLSLDTWRNEQPRAQRHIRITWRHSADMELMWNCGIKLLCLSNEDDQLRWRAFSSKGERNMSIHSTCSAQEALNMVGSITYFELSTRSCTYFADVEPIEEQELQAGIIFPATSWQDVFISGKRIATHLADTSEQQISSTRWFEILTVLSPYCCSPADEHSKV